jgi:hypothetical protein
LCGIQAFCLREAHALRLLSALAISIFLHLALILFPANHAGLTVSNASNLVSGSGVSIPLLITLAVATAELATGEGDAAITQTKAGVEAAPVTASPTTDRGDQPVEPGGDGSTLLGPELVYYTTDKLSKSPEVIAMDDLNTPETRVYKVSGSLVMNLWIDDQGKVTKVLVQDSALPPIFAETASRIFKAARFVPGERNGVRVGALMRIEVGYEDKGLPVAR